MANKKTECPLPVAKAVARMKEQNVPTEWKAGHTATLVRYIALDLLAEAKCPEEVKKAFSEKFKAVLAATPAIVESSNLGKRLVEWGEVEPEKVSYE